MKHSAIIILLSFSAGAQEAIIIQPVADLLGEPIEHQRFLKSYDSIPVCGAQPNAGTACGRIGQLLFNERVTILKRRGNELYIRIPHLYFITHGTSRPHTDYWTHKRNVLSLEQLKKNKIDLTLLPQAIQFTGARISQNNIVTLTVPWRDTQTNTVYSAGTRFVVDTTTDSTIYAWLLDTNKMALRRIALNADHCFLIKDESTTTHKRNDFISILKTWAHQPDGFIPYVWGGASFCNLSTATIHETPIAPGVSIYELADFKQKVKTGFDCSGLIARAAQIVGIPYFYKNTHTLAQKMQPLKKDERLLIGDLIWIPGHVMIISDLDASLIIEARGYSHGFGKVHEIKLCDVFANCKTFDDLKRAYLHHHTIERLDNKKQPVETIKKIKLFRLIPD